MRKGKLIIEKARTIKTGDKYLDKEVKMMITIMSVEKKGVIHGVTNGGQPCKVRPEDLVKITVWDDKEGLSFPLEDAQKEYLYRHCREHDFSFYLKNDSLNDDISYAVVFAKDVVMINYVNHMTPVANAYGNYVASQKSIGEPAKKFDDWYFDISV